MSRSPWRALAAPLALLLAAGCATSDVPPEPVADTGTIAGDASDPRNRAKLRTELASLYFQRGSFGIALEELRAATAADPNYAPAHGMFGLVYLQLREHKLAQASFERALRLAPGDSDINHNYGLFLCQTEREPESIKYFMQAVRNPLYPMPWRSWAAAGTCALRKDNVKDAEGYFQQALKHDPDEPSSLLAMGQIRYRQGSLEEARKLVLRFNRLVDPTAESLWLAVRVERKLGERVAESSYAGQLRRRYPGSREYQMLQRGEYD